MNHGLAQTLDDLHERILAAIGPWNETDAGQQLHPDLSPALWHIGHIAVVEAYWLREVVLGEGLPRAWTTRYFPENIPKNERAVALPGKSEQLAFAARLFRDHVGLLAELLLQPKRHPLLENAYLAHFLIQHCAQHQETLAQIAQQRALRYDPLYRVERPLAARDPELPAITFAAGPAHLGNTGEPWAFDNELPHHVRPHPRYALSERPVSNREYLSFMRSGGYTRRKWWSEMGWRWRSAARVREPMHWRRDANGHWYALEANGPADLRPENPVVGINRHEAEAFAHYCGCRLPTEMEWEHAANCGAIASTAVWEWCHTCFYPYPGYRSFPYPRYSQPWFDGHHFALRGGGDHTHASIRRKTFRNFYTADKRHVFAGLRLARGSLHV